MILAGFREPGFCVDVLDLHRKLKNFDYEGAFVDVKSGPDRDQCTR